MTADVELLPLYAELQGHPKLEIIKHYARANVAHATAAKDAEIERLRAAVAAAIGEAMQSRADAKEWQGAAEIYRDRVERLAEALRESRQVIRDLLPDATYAKWDAALRDHDQEAGE